MKWPGIVLIILGVLCFPFGGFILVGFGIWMLVKGCKEEKEEKDREYKMRMDQAYSGGKTRNCDPHTTSLPN